ncbi:hypothetical protein KBTX_02120 [wastewater metagenome]|uniref:Methyltransferase type 11 domain-containing protein n=2 Tax=unclassified sequences TaxID=12908 RepID=A0A5B8RAU2_9ZZZZ|nr:MULTISPECIES: class I SAM-dependent methyltransferase [Arhodomonas]MCS4505771.1 class I SAM-dependent methyltransferase [Arhodomonas aquaeolei]QEA05796.1 hypothetical protein KBTEX_02120 [uncultured organism]
MANDAIDQRLSRVYGSGSREELAAIYRDWAETYEDDLTGAGYSHPVVCLPLITRYVASGDTPLLDAGCGTGMIGPWLRQLGYSHVEGLDASDDMLEVAGRKEAYAVLRKAFLGEDIPFADDGFGAAVCMGVFTRGHVGPEGLDDLVRVVRPNGVIVFTVNEAMFERDGFRDRIEKLVEAGTCTEIETVGPYVPTPGESAEDPTYCRAIVLRVH